MLERVGKMMNKTFDVIIINEHGESSQWWMMSFESTAKAKEYITKACRGFEGYEVVSDNQHHFKVKYRHKGFNFYTTTTVYFNECYPFKMLH